MLEHGPVRIKPAWGIGGRGQVVAADPAAVEAALGAVDGVALQTYGLVVEQDLQEVTTYSVGQVRVAGLSATYCGSKPYRSIA